MIRARLPPSAGDDFTRRGMLAFRDMARRQRGLVTGGDEGDKLIGEADAAL